MGTARGLAVLLADSSLERCGIGLPHSLPADATMLLVWRVMREILSLPQVTQPMAIIAATTPGKFRFLKCTFPSSFYATKVDAIASDLQHDSEILFCINVHDSAQSLGLT